MIDAGVSSPSRKIGNGSISLDSYSAFTDNNVNVCGSSGKYYIFPDESGR